MMNFSDYRTLSRLQKPPERNYNDMELQLKELRMRRKLLEQRTEQKLGLLGKLEEKEKEGAVRLAQAIEIQNEQAKKRNKELLEEVTLEFNKSTSRIRTNNIKEAKKSYMKLVEASSAAMQQGKLLRMEEKVKAMKDEAVLVLLRAERLRQERMKEDALSQTMESQRQQLLQSFAVEHHERLEAEAAALRRQELSRATNEAFNQHLLNDANQVQQKLIDSLRAMEGHREPLSVPSLPRLPSDREHQHLLPTAYPQPEPLPLLQASIPPPIIEERQEVSLSFMSNDSKHMQQQRGGMMNPSVVPRPAAVVEVPSPSIKASAPMLSEPQISIDTSFAVAAQSRPNTLPAGGTLDDEIASIPAPRSPARAAVSPGKDGHKVTSIMMSVSADEFDIMEDESLEDTSTAALETAATAFKSSLHHKEEAQTVLSTSPKAAMKAAPAASSSSVKAVPMKQLEEIEVSVGMEGFPAVAKLLEYLYPDIENHSNRLAAIQNIYKEDKSHRHMAQMAVSRYLQKLIDMNALVAEVGHDAIGQVVLVIVEAIGSILLPREAFTGVVTNDKLKKEHKKSSIGNIFGCWEGLCQHLQRLVEAQPSLLDFLAKLFTAACTAHVPASDRDRMNRKVLNLLQLAILPSGTDDNGSPYRAKPHVPPVIAAAEPIIMASDDQPPRRGLSSANYAVDYNTTAKHKPNPVKSTFDTFASNKLSEFEDDEIQEDEVIAKPPPIRDLDAVTQEARKAKSPQRNPHIFHSNHAEEEFDF